MRKSVLLALSLFVALFPASYAAEPIGQVKTVTGAAYLQRGGERLAARMGAMVYGADVVVTGADGALGITFVDNSRFSVGPDTELALEQFRFDSTTHQGSFHSRVEHGTLTVVSGKLVKQRPGSMTVRTPSAILGVRGTTFLVRVGAGS